MQDHRYDDIIHLPRPVSQKHPPMPLLDRAAQFSPFAALSGYDAAIREKGRLTDAWTDLDDDQIAALDSKLRFLAEHLSERPEATVTWFLPDAEKDGGSYQTNTIRIKTINPWEQTVIAESGLTIPICSMIEIETPSYFE